MKYLIGGICIQFEDLPVYEMQPYNLFHIRDTTSSDICIFAQYSEAISVPAENVQLYKTESLYVCTYKGQEYRYEIDKESQAVKWFFAEEENTGRLLVCAPIYNRLLTEMELFNCISIEKILSKFGRFVLHSSFVRTTGGAILFTAPCQTGKSTQAELWRKYRNATIINGDRSCVWKAGDTWMAGGLPWCGTSGISLNQTVPLRAIVILQQGPVNEIKPLRMISKVGRLLEQTTINPWNEDMYQKAQEFWIDLCQSVPVLLLSCLPDEGAVEVLEKVLNNVDVC